MKKKIWLWNHYATDMYLNKGGRHYWFAKELIEKGFDVTIFSANTYHNKEDYIDTEDKKYATDKSENIPFVFVKTTPALGNGLDRIKNMGLFFWNIMSVAKKYAKDNGKPDVILASSVHPLTMVAGIKIAKRFNIPCICEVRDLWPEAIFSFNRLKENSLLGKMLIKGEHWIYKNADAMIFTKEGDTDYIEEKGWSSKKGGDIDLSKCYYINNGVDLESYIESIEKNQLEDNDLNDKFNVTYIGSIRPVNNVGKLLDAASKLKDKEDIQFLIYGDGNEKNKLEKRIKDENLNNVKMKGFVNKRYIPYILSKSSVNVLNYSQEKYNWSRGNSSNKLFEYMASGKPIISTVKMGYSIIDKYKCGIEIEDGQGQEIAEKILEVKELSDDEYRKLGENARIGAQDFDFKVLTSKLISVINKV